MLRILQDRIAELLGDDPFFKASGDVPALHIVSESRHDLIALVELSLAKNGAVVVVRSAGGVARPEQTPEFIAITETLEVRASINLVHNRSKRTLPATREAVMRAVHGRQVFPDDPSTGPSTFRFLSHDLEELDDQGNAVAVIRFEAETDFLPANS